MSTQDDLLNLNELTLGKGRKLSRKIAHPSPDLRRVENELIHKHALSVDFHHSGRYYRIKIKERE